MKKARFVASWYSLAWLALHATVAFGQALPNKTIRMLAPAPGGVGDFVARLIAQGASGPSAQQIIVDNRPSNLIAEMVARAVPDGSTVGITGAFIFLTPLLQKISYDPVRELSPIIWATSTPHILVVNPSLPVKSVRELIALGKAKPGELSYASGAPGGEAHLGGELFKAMAGINAVHVPYKGAGPSMIVLAKYNIVSLMQFQLFPLSSQAN
jgi:tripartite-type tricarboxylate transporter receptor subunit TctC